MTAKETLRFVEDESNGVWVTLGMRRALLVAALIDDGWDICRDGYLQDHVTTHVEICTQAGGSIYSTAWNGAIADMPEDIYDELKGRLK